MGQAYPIELEEQYAVDPPRTHWLLQRSYDLSMEQNVPAAPRQYTLATKHPVVANSKWFADLVGDPLQALGLDMSQEEVESIRQGCQDVELETTVAAMLAFPGLREEADFSAAARTQPLLDPLSERELELLRLVVTG